MLEKIGRRTRTRTFLIKRQPLWYWPNGVADSILPIPLASCGSVACNCGGHAVLSSSSSAGSHRTECRLTKLVVRPAASRVYWVSSN